MEEIRILVECEDAGGYIPCEGAVNLTTCPYDEDVNDTVTPVWICKRHLHERAMDI